MESDEQLQEKLDRVSQRVSDDWNRVWKLLEQDPQLLQVARLTKSTFGLTFKHLKIGDFERGKDWPRGICPAKYNKPPKGKGRIQWLRGLEREE